MMKNRYLILFFIAAIAGLYSCKNNDEVLKKVVATSINVVNASADTLNFYANGTRLNNTSGIYPASFSYYLHTLAGQQNYEFKKSNNPALLFGLPLNLTDSVYYSLYVYGESASKTFMTNDSPLLVPNGPDTSLVRFVNASPDAGVLNVVVGGDTVVFNNCAFKSSSAFLTVGSSGLKEVRIYLAGSSTATIDTTLAIEPDYTYTIFSKGLLNGKGNTAFGVGLVINAD
jgi:hypothetical protein